MVTIAVTRSTTCARSERLDRRERARGRAVVGTTSSGLAGLLAGSGTLVTVDDPPALARALLPYFTDAGHAAAAGSAARATVERDHDPAKVAAEVERLFERLL